MKQLENRRLSSSHTAAMAQAIPTTSHRIGFWESLISTRTLPSADIASRNDAVSGKRAARRFQLCAAYREPLLTSHVVIDLRQVEPQARILDCAVGNGSLSIALDRLTKGLVNFHAIDTCAEMLGQAKSVMQHAGLDPQQALAEMFRVLKPGGTLFRCVTRSSLFDVIVQLLWRTRVITGQERIAWLRSSQLVDTGHQPVRLGSAGFASTAIWARRRK